MGKNGVYFFSKFVPRLIVLHVVISSVSIIQLNSRPLNPGSFTFLPVVSVQITLGILRKMVLLLLLLSSSSLFLFLLHIQ
jgi:hypothetical protein